MGGLWALQGTVEMHLRGSFAWRQPSSTATRPQTPPNATLTRSDTAFFSHQFASSLLPTPF